jgi:nucleoside-diphosphate-sugar epimerase
MVENGKIIVTGGNGFVGEHLSKYLRSKEMLVIDRDGASGRILDVTDLNQLFSIGDGVEAIVHLAAKTSVNNSLSSPYETYNTNILGTLNLLEFARQKKVTKFLNVSTYVYGQPRYLPVDEGHPVEPGSPYNKSKMLAEDLCKFYSRDFEIDIVTLRPFYIYGTCPRRSSFIYDLIQRIIRNEEIITISGESTRRDFLYIDDFLRLIEIILERFPHGYNLYNVGFGQSHALSEVVQIMGGLLAKEISIRYDNKMRPDDVADMVADISKVNREFGWKPSTPLRKGLELTLERYLSN